MKPSRLVNNLVLTVCVLSASIAFSQEQTVEIDQDPLISELLILKSKMTESNELGDRKQIK